MAVDVVEVAHKHLTGAGSVGDNLFDPEDGAGG